MGTPRCEGPGCTKAVAGWERVCDSCLAVERALTSDRARIAAAIREELTSAREYPAELAPVIRRLDRLLRVVEGGK